jgi:hypothetical protein
LPRVRIQSRSAADTQMRWPLPGTGSAICEERPYTCEEQRYGGPGGGVIVQREYSQHGSGRDQPPLPFARGIVHIQTDL